MTKQLLYVILAAVVAGTIVGASVPLPKVVANYEEPAK